ncbi:PREDICTED: nephronectin, partial [Myotis davidii]|uniref:nephronectin n=1 Tax=Myotis davidii TaxID=225400 RepID=UPI0003EC5649
FDRWPRQIVSSIGLCRYGGRIDCCWGWARQSWGHCQPFYVLRQRIARIRCQLKAVCQPQCKHGECIGPNKCKCHPGYAGKTCNQDLNECGLKPRPCKHRCMNTYGSYKCYCLNGYMLMPDGSCSSGLTCSMANCQYGCDVVKGQIRCQCPSPGLQLAPDGRTCVDVDECATGRVSCPRFRQCVNTFGSYICKCHKGFDLMYIGGKYQCHDIDECSLGQYQCSSFAHCYNVHGSYKCKCKDGYHGDGLSCVYIPKVMIEVHSRTSYVQVFNPCQVPRHPSNDLFEIFEIERGVSADDEAKDDPGVLIHSCSFDHGLCGWIREKDSDLHWEPVRDPAGGQYLAVSAAKGPGGKAARLVLPLGHLMQSGDLCLSFRHRVTGLYSGALQVFVRKQGAHGAALWGRNGGHGWRQTQISLRGAGIKSVIFKGEKRRGHTGEIGLDDVSLKRGHCYEERVQLRN